MLNIAELLSDFDFCEPLSLLRSQGALGVGGFQRATVPVTLYGANQPADANTLSMMPEADRVDGARVIWSTSPIYETHISGPQPEISDLLMWHGQQFRVTKVWYWQENGYYKAYCTRMSGG